MHFKDESFTEALKRLNRRADKHVTEAFNIFASATIALLLVALIKAVWDAVLWP